jgi:hypothetical protein
LAECLFENRLSESFTPSALLRDIIEHLLGEYHDGLVTYENAQSFNNTNGPGIKPAIEVKPRDDVKIYLNQMR